MATDAETMNTLLVQVGKQMHLQQLIAGTEGNISIRTDDERIIMTRSGAALGRLTPPDLVAIDLHGRPRQPQAGIAPSSEWPMHCALYLHDSRIRAIVHAHPRHATGFALSGQSLPVNTLTEVPVVLGSDIPLIPYATPGSQDLAGKLTSVLKNHRACLLQSHGALTLGADLWEAYDRMEMLEQYAAILLYARRLGGEVTLTPEQVRQLTTGS